jgi:PST family polysaccharide transporter
MLNTSLGKALKSKLFENFSYLTALQLVNVIIPLVIYPYLIIRLGGEVYGKIIYATSLNAYLLVIVNYGFDISAIKNIAENKADKKILFQIFKNILWAKFFLLIGSYIILLIAVFTIPFVRENLILCLVSTIVTIGELFFPRWYFLGTEQLKFTTVSVVIAKVSSLFFLFLFVHSKQDFLLVPIIMGVGTIIGSMFSIKQAVNELWDKHQNLNSLKPNYKTISLFLKEGFSFFLSRGFVVIRERAGILIIGELFGFREVSVFDLIQKIIKVLTIPLDMINTVIFPRVAKTKNLKLVKKGATVALFIAAFFYFIILFFPFDDIEIFKSNPLFTTSLDLLYILGFGLLLQVFVYFFGNTVLVIFGYNKEFNFTVIFGGIIYLICLSYGFVGEITINWIGYSTLISYLCIILTRIYYINKYRLWK